MIRRRPTFPGFILLTIASVSGATEDDVVVGSVLPGIDEEIVIIGARGAALAAQRQRTKEEIDASRDAEFDRIIFMNDVTEERGRAKFNLDLECVISQLDRICRLSDSQKRNLKLAGIADQNRFFDRLNAGRKRHRFGWKIPPELNAEVADLQSKTVIGILGEDSFFAKYARRVLTEKQLEKINDRRRSIRFISIEQMLGDVERIVRLESSQREALTRLMLDEIPYSADFENFSAFLGNSERMAMMYRLSLVGEEKVRPLLNAAQWQILEPHLTEFQRFETYLTQRGLIASRGDKLDAIQK